MIYDKIKSIKVQPLLAILVLLLSFNSLIAQDEEAVQTLSIKSRGLQRVGNTFESVWLIDNQTVLVPLRKTFEFDILHRFGTVNNGYKDFLGLYAPSNIRIGFSYVPIKNLMVGFGFAKDRLLWDFNAKYAILKEGGTSGAPVSLAYYVNMAVDTREEKFFRNSTDRYSYFHQLMLARKVSRDFSVQASVSLSHFNNVEGYVNSDAEIDGKMKNDHLAFSLLGRYKISDAFAFIANYDQPITKHKTDNPSPNISAGIELATPLHAFQVFLGNYKWIVPQYNNVFNQNDYGEGQWLIGFNITRLLDAQEESLGDMMFKRKAKE
jgi:Membrane bound beta barrel domain (DUF5777)